MTNPIEALTEERAAMEALLEEIVNIDSNSGDPDGVAHVAEALAAFFRSRGVPTSFSPTADGSQCLVARTGPPVNAGHVLLLGHMDTVFPAGEATRRPYSTDGERGFGPGVADMKAGLVMNAFVVAALHAADALAAPVIALFTVDEEIGSPQSRPVIEDFARGARLVLNSEPGRISGNVVSSRRGGAFFRIDVTGRAAHAGLNPQDGRSAIGELARKILALHAMSDDARQISVNVGLIDGGQSVNTVAPHARCDVDLRFADYDEAERAEAQIRAIALECAEGLTAECTPLGKFLPLFQSESSSAALSLYLDAARTFFPSIDHEFTRSCADSGLTAAVGAPTVCATGPVGSKAHSPEEFVQLDTLVPRAQAATLAILRAAGR